MMKHSIPLALFALAALFGCGDPEHSPYLTDSFTGEEPALVGDYALGSHFDLEVNGTAPGAIIEVTSSDPTILDVRPTSNARLFRAQALQPGEVTLSLEVDGDRIDETVYVGMPDRLRFRRLDGIRSRVVMPDVIRMAAGAQEVLIVDYYEGERRLFGARALDARATDGEALAPFDNQDWLLVDVRTGPQVIDLALVTGEDLPDLTYEGVAPAGLELWMRETDPSDPGFAQLVFGRATDIEGRPLEGRFELTWEADGVALGDGQFVSFRPGTDAALRLRATLPGMGIVATLDTFGDGANAASLF